MTVRTEAPPRMQTSRPKSARLSGQCVRGLCGVLRIVALTVAIAIPFWPTATSLAAEPNCVSADALRAVGEFDQATSAYAELLKATPELECARTGLSRLPAERAARSLEIARALKTSGFKTAAAEELKKALASSPGLAVPLDLSDLAELAAANDAFEAARKLRDLGRRGDAEEAMQKAITEHPSVPIPADLRDLSPAADAFEAARKLRDLGLRTEAAEALQKAIAAHPSASVPQDLRDLSTAVPDGYQRFADGFADWATALLKALAVVIGLGYVAFLIVSVVRWSWRRWQLKIADFAAADGSPSKPVAAAIGEAIRKLEEDGGGQRLYVSDATAQDFNMPDLDDAFPQLKGFSAILTFAARFTMQKAYILNGAVHPPGDRGAGLTLTISRQRIRTVITDSITIWESDFDDGPRPTGDKDYAGYYRLATIAAIWTGYAVSRKGVATGPQPIPDFSTQNWRSYALFALGAEWRARGDLKRGRAQLVRALDVDPSNWLALFNLSTLDWIEAPLGNAGYVDAMRRAQDRLMSVRTRIEAPSA